MIASFLVDQTEVAAKPIGECCSLYVFRLYHVSCLHKMLVEGESVSDAEPFHNDQRDTISQGIRFVRALNEVSPSLMEKRLFDVD
jgi:hypothetical protein